MSVRSLTTDMGTERGIILMPYALLEQFMDHIGAKVKLSRSSHLLFPPAIHIGGWKHKMDLLIKKGLWLLPWFPQFYQRVKHIYSFVRKKRTVVCAELVKCGKAGLASVIKTARAPYAAHWRWGTLHKLLKGMTAFLAVAQRFLRPAAFPKDQRSSSAEFYMRCAQRRQLLCAIHIRGVFHWSYHAYARVGWFLFLSQGRAGAGGNCELHSER